jgi:hypothetical protein
MSNNNWIDASKKLPKDGEDIFIFRLTDGEFKMMRGVGIWRYCADDLTPFRGDEFGTVTHWQPMAIPEPPKQKDSE